MNEAAEQAGLAEETQWSQQIDPISHTYSCYYSSFIFPDDFCFHCYRKDYLFSKLMIYMSQESGQCRDRKMAPKMSTFPEPVNMLLT